jgi:hypothetical protein
MIKPGEFSQPENIRIPVPFMVLRGPLVLDDCLLVTIRIERDGGGKKAIILSRMTETDEQGRD